MYKFELRIHKHAHIECLAPALETTKTADMKKKKIYPDNPQRRRSENFRWRPTPI